MANDVIQLIIGGRCAGQFFETVQHYECSAVSGSDPVGEADNLIDGFRATVESAMLDCMAEDTELIGYKAKRVNNGGGPVVTIGSLAVAGTVTGTSATSATASCIVSRFPHTVGAVTRWKTGRWFIPGLAEGVLTGNAITGPQIGNLAALISANTTFSNGGFGYTFGVWSSKFNLFFAPVYIAPSAKVGIQRRRLTPV